MQPLLIIITMLLAPLSFAESQSVKILFSNAISTLTALEAPLKNPASEWDIVIEKAKELVDVKTAQFYRTKWNQPLPFFVFDSRNSQTTPQNIVLFFGGIHADEISPIYSSFRALVELTFDARLQPENTRLIYVPILNPDGFVGQFVQNGSTTRTNANGVDLNRNFSSKKPETETRFLKELIALYNPSHIIALHAPFGWLDYDGPAMDAAAPRAMKKHVNRWLNRVSNAGKLRINSIFKEHPGSAGNYGSKLGKHVLTIEYPHDRGSHAIKNWSAHGASIVESLRTNDE